MKKLLTTGTLSSYRPKVDGSFTLSLNILIPNKEQVNTIIDLYQQEVVVYLKEGSQVTKEETDIIDNVDLDLGDTKTPSQRLRNVLYVNWQQKNLGYLDFKEYYKFQMNKLVEHIKGKLDEHDTLTKTRSKTRSNRKETPNKIRAIFTAIYGAGPRIKNSR